MPVQENLNYPVSLVPPDISSYRTGNIGVDYIHQFDSGKPGPHVMISSIVHGNELCGAIAVDQMLKSNVRPLKGKLSLAFMNVDAYLSFDRDNPSASRYLDEDFNRLWTEEVLQGNRDSIELKRARKILPVLKTVDLLLDIHSMQTATRPQMMAGPLEKGCEFAKKMGIPEIVVMDFGHKAGRRMREYDEFSDPASKKNALLIECGQNWDQKSADLAITASWRFLMILELVSEGNAEAHMRNDIQAKQKFIEVSGPYTIRNNDFSFKESYVGLEEIPYAGTVIANDGEIEVKTPYDNCILVMPSRRQRPGDTAVRFGKYV